MTPRFRSEAFFLGILAFGPLAFGAVEIWSVAVLEICILLLFALTLHHRTTVQPAHRFFLFAALFILLLGALQRLHPVSPDGLLPFWRPFTAAAHETGSALLLWTAYAALLICASRILYDRGACRRFVWTVFLIGVVIAFVGIIQKAQGNTHFYGLREMGRWRIPFGPYANHNHAASLMNMAVCMGGGLWLSRFFEYREGGAGPFSDFVATQLLILFLLLLLGGGIIKAFSRGAYVSLMFAVWSSSFLACSFFRTRRMAWAGRTALVALGLAVLAYAFSFNGLRRIALGLHEPSITNRLSLYRSGWEMFLDAPVFGFGLGAMKASFPAYQDPALGPYFVTHVHCDWLELLIESGIAGFMVYISGLLLILFKAHRAWLDLPNGSSRCMAGGVLAAAFCFIFHSCIDFSFQIPADAVIFVAVLAWLGGPVLYPARRQEALADRQAGRTLRLTAYGLTCILIFMAVRPVVAYFYGRAATTAELAARPYYLSKAARWSGKPNYPFQLGLTYLKLAEENPLAKTILLRQALAHSTTALRKFPLRANYAYLRGIILHRLGRKSDGRALMERTVTWSQFKSMQVKTAL